MLSVAFEDRELAGKEWNHSISNVIMQLTGQSHVKE